MSGIEYRLFLPEYTGGDDQNVAAKGRQAKNEATSIRYVAPVA
jgi:hypothetical protein